MSMTDKVETRKTKAAVPLKRRRTEKAPTHPQGMPVARYFTRPNVDPFDEVEWELRTAAITGESGKVYFEQKDVEVPKKWSQMATNVVVQKYFRGAIGTPSREKSVRQLISRVADTIAGVMLGFTPSVFGNYGNLMRAWVERGTDGACTLWDLQARLLQGAAVPDHAAARQHLRPALIAQMRRCPIPTTVWREDPGTPVPAEGIAQYFATLERQGISINFGNYYSATQARVAVLQSFNRAPNGAELDRMRASMDTAMRAGAMGMTTALIYPPSAYSTTEELVELAKVVAKFGGFYSTHMRNESSQVLDAIRESIEIGEKGGVPVHIYHLKAAGEDNCR